MKTRIAVLVLAAALVEACSGQAPSGNVAAPAPADNDAAQAPTAPAGNAAVAVDPNVTPAWLTGSWQADTPQCAGGDTFFTLGEGGAYSFMAEQGRWSLAGNALTIEITAGGEDGGSRPGDRHTTRVRQIGPDEAEFTTEQGIATRVYRCRAAGR